MIRFNVIGIGFLDIEEGQSIGFKVQNQHFRFADISLGRSVQFSIPATDRNRLLLGFGDDPADYGTALRRNLGCQMVYDGGAVKGILQVTSFDGDAFKCVFYIGGLSWVDRLNEMSMKDVPDMTGSVVWAQATPVANADTVDPNNGMVQLVKYDNNINDFTAWQLAPSVHLKTLVGQVCANLGVTLSENIPSDLWLVAGKMSGGVEDTVTFAATTDTDGTITQTQNYFDVSDGQINWKAAGLFSTVHHEPCRFFKALVDVDITFPNSFPPTVYAPHRSRSTSYQQYLGDYHPDEIYNAMTGQTIGYTFYGEPLAGRTVTIKKDTEFFFTDMAPSSLVGYSRTCAPFTFQCTATRNNVLNLSETWKMENNMPDMTVFEFLRSVALATGMELTIDPDDGITIDDATYGQAGDFLPIEKVTSVDSVERVVEAWGKKQRNTITFDDEDYVTNHITSPYNVDNEHLEEESDDKQSKFSGGELGANGIVIADVDTSNKFTGKKWTIARATAGSTYLQRVEEPQPVGYDDIAANSTCLKVKVAAKEADLFALTPSTTFLWRGMAYIWTDASLSAGVMSLTLQKVSQPPTMTPNYLKFVANSAVAAIQLNALGANASMLDAVVYFSTDDGVTWSEYTYGDTISLAEGESVLFKGLNDYFSRQADAYYNFSMVGSIAASGHVTSLLNELGGDVPLKTCAFAHLFDGCTSLTTAPELPSMDLDSFCYWMTFQGCSSLSSIPELPANILDNNCYTQMFKGCSGITAAVLPATTLASNCYGSIFENCTALSSVEMRSDDISPSNCLFVWLRNVAASGTLTCDSSLVLPSGASGLPTGWTRVNL